MKSRPYASTEWLDSRGSRIQVTRTPAMAVAVSLQGADQEGFDHVRGPGLAFEGLARLGHKRAARRQDGKFGVVKVFRTCMFIYRLLKKK